MPSRKVSKQQSRHSSSPGSRLIASVAALVVLAAAGAYLLVTTFNGEADAAPLDPGPPPIVFEPAVMNFGDMPVNVTRTETVQVINTGTTPLRVIAARSSCACMRAEIAPATVQPGASAPMTLHMDSQNQPGPRTVTASVVVAGYEAPARLSVQRTTIIE